MSKQFWANLALSVILGSLAIFAMTNISSALTPRGLLATEPQPSAEATPLLPQVVLTKYQVGEGQDRVVEAEFNVRNDSGKDVKNIGIVCDFFDEQGGYVDYKRWILPETVPAGQTVRLNKAARRFVNTRARALNCKIADFQLVKEPLFALNRVAVAPHGAAVESAHGQAAPTGAGH